MTNSNSELRIPNSEFRRNKVLFTFALFLSFAFVPTSNLSAGTATPPADVTDLKAKESGNNLYLWWTAVTPGSKSVDGYKIWRGIFTGMISCAIPTTTYISSNTFFSDTNALIDNNNYYYLVKAYDSANPPNESVNFSGLGFKICRSVTYRTTISNIIWWSIPYWYRSDIVGEANAQVLANDMNSGLCTSGCSCTKVGRWTDNTQLYQNYVLWFGAWGPAGSNFGLSAGVGYLAINAQTTVWKVVGSHKTATLSWAYNASSTNYHWISVPYHALYTIADDLVNTGGTTNNKIPNCTQISRWDEGTQTYIDYFNIGSWAGTNFSLVPGEAYMIVINANSSWAPSFCMPGATPIPTLPPACALNRAYVTSFGPGNVSVIDTLSNTIVATIATGGGPSYGIAITPDCSYAYVTNRGFSSNGVSVIDTGSNTVVKTVIVGSNLYDVAIIPNGSYAYVADPPSSTVSVINTSNNTVTATVTAGTLPRAISITPNGSCAYVVNLSSANISVINTGSNTVVKTVIVGSSPYDVAITPNGSYAYVAEMSNVCVINTGSYTVIATVIAGTSPNFVAITPNGSYAYVTNYISTDVSVIDTYSNTVSATIVLGAAMTVSPQDIAFTPSGSYAYEVNCSVCNVSVIDTGSNTISTTVVIGPTGTNPWCVAIK